jgi:hypothetical protein
MNTLFIVYTLFALFLAAGYALIRLDDCRQRRRLMRREIALRDFVPGVLPDSEVLAIKQDLFRR